jgi:hypothetical protein
MSKLTGEVAARDATCPTCGLDVGGYAIGITHDGRTTWDRPTRHDAGPSGVRVWTGGLTHLEGGERCLAGVGIL